MDTKTLRERTQEGLKDDLKEAQTHLQALLFKSSANQIKNVREIREVKKTIARINTLLK